MSIHFNLVNMLLLYVLPIYKMPEDMLMNVKGKVMTFSCDHNIAVNLWVVAKLL
jgi:hypothetical protein